MALIGFDTSTAATSVCIERDDGEIFERLPEIEELHSGPTHATELMPAIELLLGRAGLGFEDLSAIAVGCGPGTYTGLRIGVATARALAGSLGLSVHPVSSLAALAAGIDAPLALPVIDARRGEVFSALYRGEVRELGPVAVRGEDLPAQFEGDGLMAVAAGNGSLRFRGALEGAGIAVVPGNSSKHVVRALHICRLAETVPPVHPQAVLPNYLRSPDAQPSR